MAEETHPTGPAPEQETAPAADPNTPTPAADSETTPTAPPAEPEPPEGKEAPGKTPQEVALAKEAQGLRGRLRDAEKARDTATAELNTLRAEVLGARVQAGIAQQAQQLGIRDAASAAIVAELALAGGTLKLSDGKVEGLDDALQAIKAKHGALFFETPGGADGGAGGAQPAGNANEWFRGQFGGK